MNAALSPSLFFLQRCNSALPPPRDSDPTTPVSHKPSVSKWASLTLPQKRALGRDANCSSWGLSIRATEAKSRSASSSQHVLIPQPDGRHSNNALPHAQVAHSELNVRVPRGHNSTFLLLLIYLANVYLPLLFFLL